MQAIGYVGVLAGLLLAGAPGGVLATGNSAKGEKVFKKCAGCHSVAPGRKKVGPSLHGVIGRVAWLS